MEGVSKLVSAAIGNYNGTGSFQPARCPDIQQCLGIDNNILTPSLSSFCQIYSYLSDIQSRHDWNYNKCAF